MEKWNDGQTDLDSRDPSSQGVWSNEKIQNFLYDISLATQSMRLPYDYTLSK